MGENDVNCSMAWVVVGKVRCWSGNQATRSYGDGEGEAMICDGRGTSKVARKGRTRRFGEGICLTHNLDGLTGIRADSSKLGGPRAC